MKKVLSTLVVGSLLLVSCGSKTADAPEQDRFISAMTEATCAAFEGADLDQESSKQKSMDIFSKYGFDVNDDSVMQALQTKYAEVPEVDAAMKKAFEDCAPQEFLDAMKALEAPVADEAPTTDAAPVTDEDPATDVVVE